MRNRHSTRLRNWDYSLNAYYFVTMCTQNRECMFGEIKNERMVLNEMGEIVKDVWKGLMNQTLTVLLDVFQIMPNHVHGIIKINNIVGVSFMKPKNDIKSYSGNINQIAKSHRHMGLLKKNRFEGNGFEDGNGFDKSNPYDNNGIITLGHVVRYFKAKSSFEIHRKGYNQKIWQRNYHDRVIRNEKELEKIKRYIKYNPLMWERDINNMDNINFA